MGLAWSGFVDRMFPFRRLNDDLSDGSLDSSIVSRPNPCRRGTRSARSGSTRMPVCSGGQA